MTRLQDKVAVITGGSNGMGHHFHQSSIPQSLITLGVAGGLIPCSEALILLLGAIALHKERSGLLLVTAFSLRLALVLMIVGFFSVYCRQWLDRLPQFKIMQTYLPLIYAIVISIMGLLLTPEAII